MSLASVAFGTALDRLGVLRLAVAARRRGLLPPDGVLVTFDDGYADNFEHALPILRRHGIRALFFVTTGCLTDRQLFWWERVNLLVRRSEERALRIEYPFAEE